MRHAACLALLALLSLQAGAAEPLRIGSKRFTESYVLAEVLARQAREGGTPVTVSAGLGNTAIVAAALAAGTIDVYPEYTGTIARELLQRPDIATLPELQAALAPRGLGAAVPLGFANGYALALRADVADRLQLRSLADLARHPELRLGLSNEFLGRADGWPGLAAHYRLPQRPQALDHGLAYQSLEAGQVDVVDAYTTDAQVARRGLRLLVDTDHWFPGYDAVLLYRLDLPQRFPAAWTALQALQGRIDAGRMAALNARAEIDGASFDTVAAEALGSAAPPAAGARTEPPGWRARLFGPDLGRLTRQHLTLVAISVALAVAVGVPLALLCARRPRWRGVLLAAAGLLQTVPSLALLAALISWMGTIGTPPALVALALYALLPVMRNTVAGLDGVSPGMRQAATALGMTAAQRLRLVELPLALPVLLAGVRTSTTIAIGTATLAAFIGAGGYGERIVTGLALNDHGLLLAGALPAAALALASEAVFGLVGRWIPRARAP
ncbi:glycine betaine ABC transporter substrate-binding protein [Xylophilus sp. GOD-11R]|uniref:glycine betaine ABC transporter substrate-binding protein n=1 Tax=Xylophilus sp. GOD-11R TaxID=3089814 RepID=UPI00298D1AA9|nr:glycine betaine ABC transporter substrate-binding protein [Xylophilus sp. GOD-11R]WPB57873.1 glycine betaine ABC transporter substrate-binding protein [Xylophilus sp. GOD-11R]